MLFKGFNDGIMIVSTYKDQAVKIAKPLVKQDLINTYQAHIYYEPENIVTSRTGNECVVALCDQWYMDYGEDEWKNQVKSYINNHLECYNPKAHKKFQFTIDWLNKWACSRTFGLGTQLPWDKQFVIESLSDSTIYFSYYTISHFLQGNTNGTIMGSKHIKPEQLTSEVFNYIYLNTDYPTNCTIDQAVLND